MRNTFSDRAKKEICLGFKWLPSLETDGFLYLIGWGKYNYNAMKNQFYPDIIVIFSNYYNNYFYISS